MTEILCILLYPALRALYDRTSSKLYGVALRVVGNRDWAEDVLQEVYLTVWRRAATYDAARASPRYSGAPWKNWRSVSTLKQAAPWAA